MQSSNKGHWFIFQGDYLLLYKQSYQLPDDALLSTIKPNFIRCFQVSHFHHLPCFAAEIEPTVVIPDDIQLIHLKKAFSLISPDWYAAVVKAYSVLNWDRNHQFCSRCGQATIHESSLFERVCPACTLAFYPRISPSVIVLISKDDQILMARSPHFPPGAYGLIAGFVEVGECLEDAVHREVAEEVGIKIKNLCYFGSQPWPFPDSLMMAFMADHASGDIIIDANEIEAADWYRFDALPGRPSTALSIASKLIDHVVEEKAKKWR